MRKPVIGLIPLIDSEKDSYWMLPGYMEGILAAGGIPVMLPLTADREVLRQLAETYDGFLFTGGHDVSPSVYGEERLPQCGECSRERDEMETLLFSMAWELDKPMFGICRGIQFFNAALGGTLYQDLPTQRPTNTVHRQTLPYDQPVHQVNILKGSPLQELLKKDRLSVNSYHHQAIWDLSPRLCAMAFSEDGLVEAVYAPERSYVWAVQWHPEFSFCVDKDSRRLFASFVQAAQSPGDLVRTSELPMAGENLPEQVYPGRIRSVS